MTLIVSKSDFYSIFSSDYELWESDFWHWRQPDYIFAPKGQSLGDPVPQNPHFNLAQTFNWTQEELFRLSWPEVKCQVTVTSLIPVCFALCSRTPARTEQHCMFPSNWQSVLIKHTPRSCQTVNNHSVGQTVWPHRHLELQNVSTMEQKHLLMVRPLISADKLNLNLLLILKWIILFPLLFVFWVFFLADDRFHRFGLFCFSNTAWYSLILGRQSSSLHLFGQNTFFLFTLIGVFPALYF